MPINLRSVSVRTQAAVCVLALTLGLAVAPALLNSAGAAAGRSTVTSQCSSAQAATQRAQKNEAAAKKADAKAKKALAKAKKALAKAKKSTAHHAANVKKAKKAVAKAKKNLAKADKRYNAAKKAVATRQSQQRSACASDPSTNGTNTGKLLSLIPLGSGVVPGSLDLSQLTTVLDTLLPGVSQMLTPDQLTALLAGFNSGSGGLDPTQATALLSGLLDPTQITSLLGGSASPTDLTTVITGVISQLSGLGGGLPVPPSFDPTGLFQTFAGMFGTLDPSQLGSLLNLLTSAVGSGSSTFSPTQLTALLDSLVPGLSSQFSPTQLTSMLSALNGSGLPTDSLSNLLGGQFSPTQLATVLGGTAGQALVGSVITEIVAELGTAGGGGLPTPGDLNAGQISTLIATVTDALTGILANNPVIPVVCGLIPIPGLCT